MHIKHIGLYLSAAFLVAMPVSGCGDGATADTCTNGVQEPGETDVDCGGTCAACETPPTPCENGVLDPNEEDIDCGGACAPCGQAPTCVDGFRNQGETDVDCGGPCPACDPGPACDNEVRDGDETGVDCGGSCPACAAGPSCDNEVMDGDETGVDFGGSCPACGVAPTCSDELQNRGESDVDCGGPCSACEVGDENILSLAGVTLEADAANSETVARFDADVTVALANGSVLTGTFGFESWANTGILPALGTYDLESGNQANYSTCDVCLWFASDDGARFFQRSGSVRFKPGTVISGTSLRTEFIDVELEEVTIDEAFVTTPVPGGRIIRVRVAHDVASATGVLTFSGTFTRGPENSSNLTVFSTPATYTPIISGAPEEVVYIAEFRSAFPGGTLPPPGEYELDEGAQANMATCRVCTRVERPNGAVLFQARGKAALNSLSLTKVNMGLLGHVLEAVTVDGSGNSTPAAGGSSAIVIDHLMVVQ